MTLALQQEHRPVAVKLQLNYTFNAKNAIIMKKNQSKKNLYRKEKLVIVIIKNNANVLGIMTYSGTTKTTRVLFCSFVK